MSAYIDIVIIVTILYFNSSLELLNLSSMPAYWDIVTIVNIFSMLTQA